VTFASSRRRRKPPQHGTGRVLPAGDFVGAVDIGATKTLVSVVASPLESWSETIEIRRFATPARAEDLVTIVTEALAELSQGLTVGAIGVAAPGPLDVASGRLLHSPNQAWRAVPLGSELAEAARAPVVLDDDANLGALGEATLGAGKGKSPVAYLTLSTGIGAGIIVDGRLVRGGHGTAGEVGHLVVNPTGPQCGCGGRGHVESYAGGAGLARRARLVWPTGRLTSDPAIPAPTDADGILRAARGGEPDARRLAAEATDALSFALAAIGAILDPGVIVIGGSLGLRQPSLVRAAAARARKRVMAETRPGLTIVPAALGPLSALAGAAILASEGDMVEATVRP
jgi:glucokinase